ncbi:MAG: hypothetical protein JWM91_58 [Rhodospirillales bacterium]|nr:hypothetical protein [Rhodospirillales bacterium]
MIGNGTGRARHLLERGLAVAAVALLASGLTARAAMAETRGFVVSWFYMAAESQADDCPEGTNPLSEVMARKWLTDMGKSPAEIEAAYKDFPNNMYGAVVMRGKVDGKPVNIYTHPTAIPDPNVKTAKGHVAYGFNLDGKNGPDDFVDPQTKETGVDDKLYRALGCFITARASGGSRPTFPAIQWDMTRDQMPAWVIEVSGIEHNADGSIMDGDVKVGFYRSTGPIMRNAAGEPQADLTFQADNDPRMQNVAHATMKNGTLTTDPFEFYMIQDPFGVSEYRFKQTRIRLTLNPDGTAKGILGGYQPWLPVYTGYALGGSVNELNLSIDAPGIYYAMKKMADAYPDSTGQNQYISSSYWIEAVPAFVVHPDKGDKTALAGKVQRLAQAH